MQCAVQSMEKVQLAVSMTEGMKKLSECFYRYEIFAIARSLWQGAILGDLPLMTQPDKLFLCCSCRRKEPVMNVEVNGKAEKTVKSRFKLFFLIKLHHF